MLVHSIGNLIKTYDNRYKLVLDVAKVARKIAKDIEESNDSEKTVEKPVSLAIRFLEKNICQDSMSR
ncbi:MAG TPA: DNA-directed RNA polymerase subunit omega [Clostridiales bacterium]|nr:DNA-directed RNA polymerase subunit omega [Clostridiales bacterium]